MKTKATSAIAMFLADDPELEDFEDVDDLELEDAIHGEPSHVEPADPWKGYDAAHRKIPPAMARTIETMDAILEGRPVPSTPPASPAAPRSSRDDEKDDRGNTLRVRRYMARAFEAERTGTADDLAVVLRDAGANPDATHDDLERLASVVQSITRRRGYAFAAAIQPAVDALEDAIDSRLEARR